MDIKWPNSRTVQCEVIAGSRTFVVSPTGWTLSIPLDWEEDSPAWLADTEGSVAEVYLSQWDGGYWYIPFGVIDEGIAARLWCLYGMWSGNDWGDAWPE